LFVRCGSPPGVPLWSPVCASRELRARVGYCPRRHLSGSVSHSCGEKGGGKGCATFLAKRWLWSGHLSARDPGVIDRGPASIPAADLVEQAGVPCAFVGSVVRRRSTANRAARRSLGTLIRPVSLIRRAAPRAWRVSLRRCPCCQHGYKGPIPGADARTRTGNRSITSRVRCQLRHAGGALIVVATDQG
jgi:hypothetical protein